ncbi:MAG: hypothetical protein R3Y56_07505 [Akkermansia sp.]
MKILKITMPHPSDVLSPNQGLGNRYAVNNARKAAKELARVKMLCELTTARAGEPELKLKPEKLAITWYYKGKGHDVDNIVAICKAYIDGASKAMKVNDGDFITLRAEKVKSKHRAGEVELCFLMRRIEEARPVLANHCPFCGAVITEEEIMCVTCEDEANFGKGEL